MNPTHIFVIGPTNAGKSSVMDAVKQLPNGKHATIEIGKALRAKYPPEYFAGQSNPKHTAVEAWSLFVQDSHKHTEAGARYIWVDGQPRDLEQAHQILERFRDRPAVFVHLHARREVRLARAQARDTDPAKLALSMARMDGDIPAIYEILALLNKHHKDVMWCDTESTSPADTVAAVLGWLSW